MGQFNHFNRAAPEKLPYAIKRYHDESFRVIDVLEIRLSGKYTGEPREYLAGNGKGKYSIADIGTWAWVKNYKGVLTEEEIKTIPNVVKWVDRIAEKDATKIGISDKYATK
jgi:glutathione S-transferase